MNTEPMDRLSILRAMKAEFSAEELSSIIIGAGAALVVYGAKQYAADIDAHVDSLHALKSMASIRNIALTASVINKQPRLEIAGFVELFYDPDADHLIYGRATPRFVVIEGVKFDSIPATVAWYEYMVKTLNRPKDIANLELAKALLFSDLRQHVSRHGFRPPR